MIWNMEYWRLITYSEFNSDPTATPPRYVPEKPLLMDSPWGPYNQLSSSKSFQIDCLDKTINFHIIGWQLIHTQNNNKIRYKNDNINPKLYIV